MVVQALREGETKLQRYSLHAFVVMANHVHILVTPNVPTAKWLGPLKGFTAYQANRVLERKGAFWQDESYETTSCVTTRSLGAYSTPLNGTRLRRGW